MKLASIFFTGNESIFTVSHLTAGHIVVLQQLYLDHLHPFDQKKTAALCGKS